MKLEKNNSTLISILVILILALLSTVVIGDFRLSSIIYPALWIGIPILVYFLAQRRSQFSLFAFLGIIVLPYFLGVLFFLLQFGLCGYSQMQDEYVNRKNNRIKLVGRDYSCYGTLNDLVLYKQITITKNIKVEFYYKKYVDYKNIDIDTTLWKPVYKYY